MRRRLTLGSPRDPHALTSACVADGPNLNSTHLPASLGGMQNRYDVVGPLSYISFKFQAEGFLGTFLYSKTIG
jgi:hypothetical protein